MTDKPTICVKCVHFSSAYPGTRIWHNATCAEPKIQPPREKDFVFGGLKAPAPVFCRDINKGACPHFQPK